MILQEQKGVTVLQGRFCLLSMQWLDERDVPESKWDGDFYCFHYLSCLNQLLHKSWDGLRAKAADCKPRVLWFVLYFCLIARLWTGMFLSGGSSGFQNKLCVFTCFILFGEMDPASLQWGVLTNGICRHRFWSTVYVICQRPVNYLRALWVKEKLQLKPPSFGTLKISQDWHQVLEITNDGDFTSGCPHGFGWMGF